MDHELRKAKVGHLADTIEHEVDLFMRQSEYSLRQTIGFLHHELKQRGVGVREDGSDNE